MNKSVKESGLEKAEKFVAPDLASPDFKADPYPFYARVALPRRGL